MALISCHECKNTISDTAYSCPNCGAPLRRALKYSSPLDTSTFEESKAEEYKKLPLWLGILIILCPILFVWLLLDKNYSPRDKKVGFIYLALSLIFYFWYFKSPDITETNLTSNEAPLSQPDNQYKATENSTQDNHPPIESTKQQKNQTVVQVSALKYYADYQKNEVSADQKYKSKTILLQGMVYSINKDYSDDVYLSILGSNDSYGIDRIHANLLPTELQTASRLVKGDIVQLICTGGTMIMGFPVLDNCQIDGIDQQKHQKITENTKYLPVKPSASTSSNPSYTVTSQRTVVIDSSKRDYGVGVTPNRTIENKNNSISSEVDSESSNTDTLDPLEH